MSRTISDTLLALAHITRADRALLLRADKHTDPPLVTIEHEYHGDILPSVRRHWQKRCANGVYGAMLRRVTEKNHIVMVTKSMPAGVLRNLYSTQGVAMSIVCTAGHQEIDVHRYVSIQFCTARIVDIRTVEAMTTLISKMISRGS